MQSVQDCEPAYEYLPLPQLTQLLVVEVDTGYCPAAQLLLLLLLPPLLVGVHVAGESQVLHTDVPVTSVYWP